MIIIITVYLVFLLKVEKKMTLFLVGKKEAVNDWQQFDRKQSAVNSLPFFLPFLLLRNQLLLIYSKSLLEIHFDCWRNQFMLYYWQKKSQSLASKQSRVECSQVK